MEKRLALNLAGEEFIFDCRRGVYWPRHKILIGADLHWGKTQFLRNHGVSISDAVFDADLRRLGHLLQEYDVRTFLVLGDLVHHEEALSPGVVEKIGRFREAFPCEMILVKGNHDRFTKFPESWGIVEESDFYLNEIAFHHEHRELEERFQFSGHVHPMVRLRSGHDRLRLPSYLIGEKFCLLPAFSHSTGGQDIRPSKGQKAIVLMDDGLEIFTK